MKKYFLTLISSFLIFFFNPNLYAQTVSLDADFGKRGIVKKSCKKGFLPAKILLQTDGKLLAIGSLGNKRKTINETQETDFAIFRFLPNGKKDKSFGQKGIVKTDVNMQVDRARSAALQADGKILVVGNTGSKGKKSFILLRYLIDGNLDTSFGDQGKQITKIGEGENTGTQVLPLANGKILLVGHLYDGYDEDFVLICYDATGKIDPTFGKEGIVKTDFENQNDDATAVLILSDGRILVGGSHEGVGIPKNFALACYHPDGSLDKNFGVNGKVIAKKIGTLEETLSLIATDEKNIMLVGRSRNKLDFSTDLVFSRFSTNGKLDKSLNGGRLNYKFRADSIFPNGVVVQSDGKIIVVGGVRKGLEETPKGFDFAIARYLSNGNVDTSFDGNGLNKSKVDKKSALITSALQQNDGKFVALGINISKKSKNKLILVRYIF